MTLTWGEEMKAMYYAILFHIFYYILILFFLYILPFGKMTFSIDAISIWILVIAIPLNQCQSTSYECGKQHVPIPANAIRPSRHQGDLTRVRGPERVYVAISYISTCAKPSDQCPEGI